MKNLLLIPKALAVALIASPLLLTSCDKTKTEDPTPQVTTNGTSTSNLSAEDKQKNAAFDKEISRIISQMEQDMKKVQNSYTKDPDVDFAHLTIVHHDAGIAMAQTELTYGHHDEAKKLAESSIRSQKSSKQRLTDFLASHGTPEPAFTEEFAAFRKEMDAAIADMIEHMRSSPNTLDVDYDFAEVFKRHHQGIVKMSSIEVEFGDDDPVTDEGKMIIRDQGQEVIELSQFINKHGYPR
ncbi:DUF305 domain-containing protein [Hymenobacter sp. UV11]|uniref:DUF305 domain-containing protein n=1 Tax=Hymenobacter sp. UV11 TaxID=1849735 RepID=UPI00105FAC22|nr:DUF305 domain-containing protein [Hymenobacter sp. UV11]TDN36959.1 hypothetical protein A8B98_06085 [Hymenobacter sp. UV11]TFZ64283.1 DUF305 domain-containing protein [Hymenobacter sp. UV11]